MIKESRFGSDALNRDIRAGNRVSALLVIGPKGSGIHVFNAKDGKASATGDKGDLKVTVGKENFAFVRDLESDAPASEPPNRAAPGVVPGAGNTYHNDIESFG